MSITQEVLKKYLGYDPETGRFVSLKSGKKVGFLAKKGYIKIYLSGLYYKAHRLAWLYVHGRLPEFELDHINNDPSDNRIENLREATFSQNNANRRVSGRCATGTKGVTFERSSMTKYRARIKVNKQMLNLGLYENLDEAAHAYNKAAIQHFGEFACLNPIGVDK